MKQHVFSSVLCASLLLAATNAQAITSGADDDDDSSVVLMRAKVGHNVGFCSGVVVSPHAVLTAGHCTDTAATYEIFTGPSYAEAKPEDFVAVVQHVPHPKYQHGDNQNDIGLLITKDPLPRTPVAVNRRKLDKTDVGHDVRIVGFGQRVAGDAKSTGRRTKAETKLARLDTYNVVIAGTPNFCLEDSGGPTLMKVDGVDAIVGIHSIVDSASCDGEGLDTRVDRYLDFIDEQLTKADPPAAVDSATSSPPPADPPADVNGAQGPVATPPTASSGGCTIGARPMPFGWGAIVGFALAVVVRLRVRARALVAAA